MDRQQIADHLGHTIDETHFDDLGTRYQGKVRDTYRQGDRLILVTTDRISAFDHVLAQTIPFKGQVLNQTAAYFFEATEDLVPNHVIEVPDPNVTVAESCTPIPIEFVVRGYLAGHAWREYDAGARTLCGQSLPDGLRQSEALPEPIVTPTTKAETGHDQDVTPEEAIESTDITTAEFEQLREWSLALFARGTEMAAEQGLLLVDTKYEFGRTQDGDFVLIDEVHTPDSSRYYYQEGYEERLESGTPQEQLSKEFVREWLMDHDFQGGQDEVMPDLPDSFRMTVTERYIELYERVTGLEFTPSLSEDPKERIHEALSSYHQEASPKS
jgi:phosphoribosylaminoimidazole-succinocarboxamide synthase